MSITSSYLQNFTALKYLPRFFKVVYLSSPKMFVTNVLLRLIKSIFPVIMLWVGKEIIDEVILHTSTENLALDRLYLLIGIELGIALLSDIFNRLIGVTDTLMGNLYSNDSSVELIQKTAKVDLEYLEDSEFYDKYISAIVSEYTDHIEYSAPRRSLDGKSFDVLIVLISSPRKCVTDKVC